MPVVSETAACIRFFGDDLDPDALTSHLGRSPSKSEIKGQVIQSPKSGHARVAKRGLWLLEVDRRKPGDLDAQVAEILDGLGSDLAVWGELSAFKPELFVGFFMRETNEGLEISADTLARLAERGISISFDIYAAFDDADTAELQTTQHPSSP